MKTCQGVEVELHHSPALGSGWKWVVRFTPRPLNHRGNRPRYPLDRRLGGTQIRPRCCGGKKKLTPAGIGSQAFQPIAHCYTDWVIPTPKYVYIQFDHIQTLGMFYFITLNALYSTAPVNGHVALLLRKQMHQFHRDSNGSIMGRVAERKYRMQSASASLSGCLFCVATDFLLPWWEACFHFLVFYRECLHTHAGTKI
jgi:hypothetical protein